MHILQSEIYINRAHIWMVIALLTVMYDKEELNNLTKVNLTIQTILIIGNLVLAYLYRRFPQMFDIDLKDTYERPQKNR